jgi:hypothetical protein
LRRNELAPFPLLRFQIALQADPEDNERSYDLDAVRDERGKTKMVFGHDRTSLHLDKNPVTDWTEPGLMETAGNRGRNNRSLMNWGKPGGRVDCTRQSP